MADSYVLNKGHYEPINVIPAGNIKCTVCHNTFPAETIEDHLSQHISPKFLSPPSQNNKLKKLLISEHLLQQNEDNTQIAIKSMNQQQFPNSEIQRRKIVSPTLEMPMSLNNLSKLGGKAHVDKNDLTSILGGGKLEAENIQFLPLQANIQIKPNQVHFHKNKISIYQNQKGHLQIIDNIQSSKKIPALKQPENSLSYKIVNGLAQQTEPSENSNKTQTIKIRPNFTLEPHNILKTGTKDKKMRPREEDASEYSDVSQYVPFSPNKGDKSRTFIQNEDACDCKCPCCGGFYCSVCKSNIPPQFRPVPHKNESQRQMQDSIVTNFWGNYNQSGSKRNVKTNKCQNCTH